MRLMRFRYTCQKSKSFLVTTCYVLFCSLYVCKPSFSKPMLGTSSDASVNSPVDPIDLLVSNRQLAIKAIIETANEQLRILDNLHRSAKGQLGGMPQWQQA